jgi:2-methylisocitrate lyase-like PEP mutase family enzyme
MSGAAQRLRDLVIRGEIIAAPGAHDALDARIIERAGHQAVYLGGNALALGRGKGQPFLTLTETAAITAQVTAAVALPAIVDAGAGFGAPEHVDAAVRELERAGAAALQIDDQPYPKSANYHRGRGALVAVEAMCERLQVAVAARRNDALSILARTDALRVTCSLEQTIERIVAYAATGIDGIVVLDLSHEQVGQVIAAVPQLPIYWIGGVHPPVPNLQILGNAGFAVALYPFSGIAEITTRLGELWRGLAQSGDIIQNADDLGRSLKESTSIADLERAWSINDRSGRS